MNNRTTFVRSICKLIFTLAAPLLIWPSTSSAYFSAPLSPLYEVKNVGRGCTNIKTLNYTGGTCSTFLGYIATGQEPGTVPFYKVNKRTRGCTSTFETVNTTGGSCATRLGYIYTQQVAGTVPIYRVGTSTRGGCVGTNSVTTAAGPCHVLLGYIHSSIPESDQYTVWPKYFIGSVRYVPPGAGSSSIGYGSGTVTGTTLSTTQSWNSSVTTSAGIDTSIGSAEITFGNTFGGSTTQSFDMTRTTNISETFRAPSSNAINHDYDLITLYFGVKVITFVDYLGQVTWSVDFSQIASQGFAENGYNIAVGCLRLNSTIPPSECANSLSVLAAAGVTEADYPAILGANPFADPTASSIPDLDRYVLIDAVSYFYQPTVSTHTYTESNNTTISNSVAASYSYSVSASSNLPLGFMKSSNSFTWTNSSTTSNSTGTSNTGTFTLSNPSAVYNGPTVLFVYLDTIYKTFMFSFE